MTVYGAANPIAAINRLALNGRSVRCRAGYIRDHLGGTDVRSGVVRDVLNCLPRVT
jgi:hypothetical protein